MEQLVKEIEAKMAEFAKNANDQVEKGNKAASVRARKSSLELEKLFKKLCPQQFILTTTKNII